MTEELATRDRNKPRGRIENGMYIADGIMVPVGSYRPPFIKLNGKDGTIERSDTGQTVDFIEVIAVSVQGTRAWGKYEEGVKCASSNGVVADMSLWSGEPTAFPGKECSSCEFHDQGNQYVNTGNKGFCAPGFNCIVQEEDGTLLGLRLRGTGNDLGSQFLLPKVFGKTLLRVTMEHVSKPGRDYYKPTGKAVRVLDEGEQEIVKANRAMFNPVELGQESSSEDNTTAIAVDNSGSGEASEEEWRDAHQASKDRLDEENAEQGQMGLEGDDPAPAKAQVGDGPDVDDKPFDFDPEDLPW